MFVQKVPHIKDQFLTQERASMELESGQIAVGWYTNEQDSQSVVHSHPYYELGTAPGGQQRALFCGRQHL